jgi:hypothetical protein
MSRQYFIGETPDARAGNTSFLTQGILQDWPGSSAGQWWFVGRSVVVCDRLVNHAANIKQRFKLSIIFVD